MSIIHAFDTSEEFITPKCNAYPVLNYRIGILQLPVLFFLAAVMAAFAFFHHFYKPFDHSRVVM